MGVIESLQDKCEDVEALADELRDKVDYLEYLVAHLLVGKTVAVCSGDYGTGTKQIGEVVGFTTTDEHALLVVRVGPDEITARFERVRLDGDRLLGS